MTCLLFDDPQPTPIRTTVWSYDELRHETNRKGHFMRYENKRLNSELFVRRALLMRNGISLMEAKTLCVSTLDGCIGFTETKINRFIDIDNTQPIIMHVHSYVFYHSDDLMSTVTHPWLVDEFGLDTYLMSEYRHRQYTHVTGYIGRGNDLQTNATYENVHDAMDICHNMFECGGFTYEGRSFDPRTLLFKSKRAFKSAGGVYLDADAILRGRQSEWTTFTHDRVHEWEAMDSENETLGMETGDIRYPAVNDTFVVDIYRERPMLIAVVRNFSTEQECAYFLHITHNKTLYRSMVSQCETLTDTNCSLLGVSSHRVAKSTRIEPHQPHSINRSAVYRYRKRSIAAVSALTAYDLPLLGQEPLSPIVYNKVGDQYRSHCDGSCMPFRSIGTRTATSILYCAMPDVGGQTFFNSPRLLLKPRPRDLLVFGYKYPDYAGDGQRLSEHGGCPLKRDGDFKMIVAQWLRDHVGLDRDYEHFRALKTLTRKTLSENEYASELFKRRFEIGDAV